MDKKNLRKEERDIKTVKEISKILITISCDDKKVKIKLNDNLKEGIGGIIAVIGHTKDLKEVLLLEVGIGRSRPYAKSRFPGYYVDSREKIFKISLDQHKIVMPHILEAIQLITDLRIENWKVGCPTNPFKVKYKNNWYTKRGGFSSREICINKTPSIRFSFHKSDQLLVDDMFCLFLSSDWTRCKMIGLGRFIDKALSVYRDRKRTFKKFELLKNVREVKRVLSRWPTFLTEEMLLNYLPDGNKNFFFDDLAELIRWDGLTISDKNKKAFISFVDDSCYKIRNKINYVRETDQLVLFDICPSNYDPTKK